MAALKPHQLVAIAPVRGVHWTGLAGVAATPACIGVDAFVSVSVRVRAQLDEGSWVPGSVADRFRGLFIDTLPRPEDAIPIKDTVDVLASFEGASGFREKTIEVASGSARATIDRDAGAFVPNPPFVEGGIGLSLERDAERFQQSPPGSRLGKAEGDLSWSIDGVRAAAGSIGFAVGVRADHSDGLRSVIDMDVDTVRLLLAEQGVELIFRGLVVESAARLLDRLVLAIVPPSLSDDEISSLLDAGLPTARFAHAANAEDARSGTRPAEPSEEEMTAARMSAWSEGPGEPSLTPEEYREIVAELGRRPRKDALADFGFDEISWTREEWAVAEILARAGREMGGLGSGEEGEPSLDPETQAWVEALEPSPHRDVDLDAFARMTAHLSVRDPGRVLVEMGLTVSEMMSQEAGVQELLDADPAELLRFEALVARYQPEAVEVAAREADEESKDEAEA